MDPIKVDFSGGKGKEATKPQAIVLPPNRAGIKVLINIIGALLIGAIAYYFYLPALNFKAIEAYIFCGIVLAGYCVMAYFTSGAFKAPEYAPYVRKQAKIPVIIGGVILLVVLVGFIISSTFFRASRYHNIIKVETTDFSKDINEADFDSVPLLDNTSAAMLADKALSTLVDVDGQNLVSQFTVYPAYTQINYKGIPVRTATLKYSNIIKWLTNRKNGLPGYLVINMRTQKVEFQKVEGGMIYSNADHFNHLLKRQLRFTHPTSLLGEAVFELDENGTPYWVCPILDKTIGLFGGTDVIGVVLVNPTTGECKDYSIDELRSNEELQWIDRAYDSNLLVEQYNYFGRYVRGFWNAFLGQKDVVITTDGYNYLALNDDVWMYTGVTSVNAGDSSITGFALINQRTKEAKFYRVNGATEFAAQKAAEGKVQQYGYTATFPLLLNIGEQPTYFMALKDKNEIVQQYAMVNVNQFTTMLTTGTSISGCLESYTDVLKASGINTNVTPDQITEPATDGDAGDSETVINEVTGKIAEIRTAVIGGNSIYYVKLDSDTAYYSVSAAKFEEIVIAKVGDDVTIKANESEKSIIEATGFEIK